VSLPFIQYCEDNNIIPLCLPPHSTHILQPLDVGIVSPLAKAYQTRIQQHSMFGAERITNQQFLKFFQLARKGAISLRNIASA
jgi:DDE superfamily endonuclease